ncbi:MAG TPA: class I SAM-dependent methyltransferase, partial [Planctomycetota bacterium]|nr:class I SAM-dependent methyltransferase [Planctomycetota bacterium]
DAELYDVLLGDYALDVEPLVALARESGGPVLEVACGTGRVLLPIARAGIAAEGVDLSEPMVRRLRERAAREGLRIRAEVADMRTFDLGRRFRFVYCVFNGFAHNETLDDALAALRRCHAHLEPGGRVLVQLAYPMLSEWGGDGTPALEHETVDPRTGRKLRMFDARTVDVVKQTQVSRMTVEEVDESGRVVATHPSVARLRWFYPGEMECLLRLAGFARVRIDGGLDGRPLATPNDSLVASGWA